MSCQDMALPCQSPWEEGRMAAGGLQGAAGLTCPERGSFQAQLRKKNRQLPVIQQNPGKPWGKRPGNISLSNYALRELVQTLYVFCTIHFLKNLGRQDSYLGNTKIESISSKCKAHKIGVQGWDLGRTGLTRVSRFALEQGSVFIGRFEPNNKTRLHDRYQRSSFVFRRSCPTKEILLEALQSFAEADPARQAGAAVELQHPRETWAAALLKSLLIFVLLMQCARAQLSTSIPADQSSIPAAQSFSSPGQRAGMESSPHAKAAVPLFHHQISALDAVLSCPCPSRHPVKGKGCFPARPML